MGVEGARTGRGKVAPGQLGGETFERDGDQHAVRTVLASKVADDARQRDPGLAKQDQIIAETGFGARRHIVQKLDQPTCSFSSESGGKNAPTFTDQRHSVVETGR